MSDTSSSAAFQELPEKIKGSCHCPILFLCDHASNAIPVNYENLGLPQEQLIRHIAYDIGAAEVTRCLARHFKAHAVLSTFSRLLIDPNRGRDDPTLVMKFSDGTVVPGNRSADQNEVNRRLMQFYDPYDQAISDTISHIISKDLNPIIISIHSFTPHWRGRPRPWEIGILWDQDKRLAAPLLKSFAQQGIIVGNNEPYSGALEGDTLNRHATKRGFPHVLIEIRQDLISHSSQCALWSGIVAEHIRRAQEIL